MPFARKTLTELRQSTLADIATRLPGSNPFQRRTALNVFGTILAGGLDDQFGYLDWQAKQAVPFTAEAEYLEGWSALKARTRKAASFASGTATIAGGVPTSTIPINTELTRQDGTLYKMSAGTTVAGDGTATLQLAAEVAGVAGNTDPGTILTFSSPLAGVPPSATVVTLEGGAEVESDASLRTRMLQAFAAPPQGGDLADYIGWALEVPGVTRAWAGGPPVMGAGTVTVYFMLDDNSHTNGLPIGSNGVSQFETRAAVASGDQLLVADHIYPVRPVTALVYANAPIGDALAITLSEVPVDTAIRAGITASVKGFLLREASPGGIILPDLSAGGTIRVSHLEDAIAATPNLDHFVMTVPAADVTVATGHISVPPGSITYL